MFYMMSVAQGWGGGGKLRMRTPVLRHSVDSFERFRNEPEVVSTTVFVVVAACANVFLGSKL